MQHGPGAKTIKWLDTPEDIKKWREDRKRNFPTAANIARKREQEEEKRTRGDVLETKEFGKMKRGRGQRGRGQRVRGRGRGQHWGQRQHPGQVSAEVPVQSSSPAEMEDEVPTKKQKTENTSHHTSSLSDAKLSSARDDTDEIGDDQVRPADQHTKDSDDQPDCDPLSLLAENEGSGDEDPTLSQGVCHENQNAVNPAIEVAPKGTVGALGSLAMSYNSDSSEDSGTESTGKEANTDVTPIQTVEQPKPKEDVLTTAKAELEVDKHNDPQSRGHSLSKRKIEQRKQKRRKAPLSHIPSKRRKPTLLEMLLAPEICRERNTILQCVRYIVKNGFFQGTDADT
ncbi:FMR1-interacting protein NUFIP1-like [Diadema setosum]|uniref:FMR1-interacting protein NUFIP1-like n=1 Tax=Diadema setosum TaxID=31175 RepID=UPI003B3A200D